jgi:hypothetical protein
LNTTHTLRPNRVPIHLAAAAAVLTGTLGAIAGAAITASDNRATNPVEQVVPAQEPAATPVYLEVLERARLREAVDHMPAGWPATEVMRRQLDSPLGDAAERARWRDAAERMPAGWPATEATRRSGAEPSD